MMLVCRELIGASYRESIDRAPIDFKDENLRRFLVHQLAWQRDERMLAIFGTAERRLITVEVVAQGAQFEVAVPSRAIFSRAMALDAGCLLLAHNHPSGCTDPSEQDLVSTRDLIRIGSALGIELIDHLIVAGRQITSMAEGGYL